MPSKKPSLKRFNTVEEAVVIRENQKPSAVRSRTIVLSLLLAFRLVNALSLRTFFQPDEYYQSLEPAWEYAFGPDSGAWITWEWRHKLRSSIHPLLFAAVYKITDSVCHFENLDSWTYAKVIIAAPRIVQGIFAALTDYYTWTFAQRIYGISSHEAWTALFLTLVNPWQWYCSTRTLYNCLETTLTILALSLWPWKWPSEVKSVSFQDDLASVKKQENKRQNIRLQKCFVPAAFACILRPTNIIIWATLSFLAFFKPVRPFQKKSRMLRGTPEERDQFCRKAICVGVSVLTISFLADYAYFHQIAFPPLKFLHFNLVQSLAVFYGVNDWHYYMTQGFPLLLTTTLPFAFTGLARELFIPFPPAYKSIKRQLAIISIALPSALSFISHKEVRFIYPILPCLHILAAPSFVDYFGQILESASPVFFRRLWTLGGFLLANFLIGCYTSHTHASGVFEIFSFLRTQFLDHYNGKGYPGATSSAHSLVYNATIMTVGFLMPCHSTPWRSHLVFPDIHAWALSCEPPVNFSPSEKREYLDEADQFYDNAWRFLGTHMTGGFDHLPNKPSYEAPRPALYDDIEPICDPKQETMHDWPDYLVFYQQFEPEAARYLSDSSYGECHRSFNTAWHDDWRRQGDMIVWCLDPEIQKFWKELKLVRGTQTNPVQDATAKGLIRAKSFASPYVGNASVWTTNTGKKYALKGVSQVADLLWKWIHTLWPFPRLPSWLPSQSSPSDFPQMAPLPALREQANEDDGRDQQRKS